MLINIFSDIGNLDDFSDSISESSSHNFNAETSAEMGKILAGVNFLTDQLSLSGSYKGSIRSFETNPASIHSQDEPVRSSTLPRNFEKNLSVAPMPKIAPTTPPTK